MAPPLRGHEVSKAGWRLHSSSRPGLRLRIRWRLGSRMDPDVGRRRRSRFRRLGLEHSLRLRDTRRSSSTGRRLHRSPLVQNGCLASVHGHHVQLQPLLHGHSLVGLEHNLERTVVGRRKRRFVPISAHKNELGPRR